MDTTRVVIENWPKTNQWVEYAPLFVAIIAVGMSLWAICISRTDLIASHRPYVWALTFAYLDEDNRVRTDPNIVATYCINAPAEITKAQYSYIVETDSAEKTSRDTVYTQVEDSPQIVYPVDPKTNQVTYRIGFNLEAYTSRKDIKVIRAIRIDYKEVSSKRKYFFEGTWEYSREGNTWQPITLRGN